eukprot:m.108340 g.108340  ORF g.108340 m.108340 type:complete len:139 (-) comp13959_c0_seq2:386-802(-)
MAHKLLYLLRKPSTNPILVAGNPLLRKAASQVDLTDVKAGKLKETINRMVTIMREHGASGLAAPQIGISQQIFAMEVTKEFVESDSWVYGQGIKAMTVLLVACGTLRKWECKLSHCILSSIQKLQSWERKKLFIEKVA